MTVRLLRNTLALLAAGVAATLAHAQAWPAKPVRLIVSFPPGGSSDIVARVISPPLGERLGQPVVVENRPGAGASIGAAVVAQSPPDGYTLFLSNTTPLSITPFMLDRPPYDPLQSFTHVFYIGQVPNVFVVHPGVPAKTFDELVAWIRGQPRPVNYGSGGIGSIGHIVGEVFKSEFKLRLEHVPYKGSGPMHADLFGGSIPMAVDALPQNVPHMKDGKLRLIAVTSSSRMALAPDLPTVVEVGQPKLLAENFLGVSAPAGLPAPVADRVRAEMIEVMARPEVVKRLEELGFALKRMSQAEFTEFVRKQVEAWGSVVKASGARLN
jgi:tripartite-type tricarboxylate transporter receptor subunit TctC